MLILQRQRSGTVVITAKDGTRLTVQVVEIRGGICRLGITAPKEYTVNRGEIQELIDAEKRAADNATDPDFGKDYA